ncbi:MAG: hypothetical protein ACW98I_02855 [Candidatus Hodarchaeales archaeon]|jgi:hypothetical protein
MEESVQTHNDELMASAYEILRQCKENSLPCFVWGGGGIYHLINGKLDYRKMSDIEFMLPKSADKKLQKILEDLGFIPYSTFNNVQNMYSMPRREFYLPDRELTDSEIENLQRGRRRSIENVKFQKVELFIDGIRMCWKFNIGELPKIYADSVICPPGFQIALKLNPIHPDDFDLKDIQDITQVLNQTHTKIVELDSIFTEPQLSNDLDCCIGTKVFERFARTKDQFITTVHRNLLKVLEYPELNEQGRLKAQKLIDFISPLLEKDKGGFLSKMRREKPVRVDARER